MAIEDLGIDQSYTAADNYSSYQFYLVAIDPSGTNQVILADGFNPVVGVIENKPTTTIKAVVRTASGVRTKVRLGGDVTAGCFLEATGDGTAVKVILSGSGTAVVYLCGIACSAGSTGETITMETRFETALK